MLWEADGFVPSELTNCADQSQKHISVVFTYLFGGGNGNEGLGFLSMCFDFQYIGSGALYLPPLVGRPNILRARPCMIVFTDAPWPKTQLNIFIGFCLNIVLFSGIYYSNIWRAKDFPFLSQLLFSEQSNNTLYQTYDQLSVLGSDGVVDPTLLEKQGLPWMSASFAAYVLTQNLAITATITHLCLWNWDDLKSAWSFMAPSNLRKLALPETYMFWRPRREYTSEELAKLDPHYRLMMRYPDAPNWWYGMVLLLSAIIGLACIYEAKSGMSWYGFIISTLLSAIFILFTGAQTGLTGFSLPVQPIIQMIGAYLEPGKPVTNMYFTLFGYNSVNQGLLLLGDLKLGQYAKLSPRCLFTMQMVGTLFGAVLNYFIMVSITDAQRSILLSIEGTHIWSGAVGTQVPSSKSCLLAPERLTNCTTKTLGIAIIQYSSCYLGWSGQVYVLLGQDLHVCAPRAPLRLLCSAALLLPAQVFPQVGHESLQRLHHLLAYWLACDGHQQLHHKLLHRGLSIAVRPATLQARLVPPL